MILSLGSVNADFLVRADEPPSGPGAQLVRELLRTSGGKAANVAVLATRLGAPATLLCCVGDDDLAEQALAGPVAAGVDCRHVLHRPVPTGYSSVIVPPDGAKSIFLHLGANDDWPEDLGGLGAVVAGAPAEAVLVADLEVPAPVVVAALRASRERGLVTVLDPAPPDRVTDELLGLADHVTPDHSEAEELTGIDPDRTEAAMAAASALRDRGAGAAYVKLADGGCALAWDGGTATVEAAEVDVVDATGAGDAFAGALAWALWRGAEPVEAARVAVAASTCAVTGYGSQESYPDRAGLDAVLARTSVAA